jgi:hypothetical protein
MSSQRAWIALLPVVLLLGGCGGGSDNESTSAETNGSTSGTPTKTELIEQGDAVCAKTYTAVASLNPLGTTKEAVKVAVLYSRMLTSLEALGPPQNAESSYAEYINRLEAFAEAENGIQSTAQRNQTAMLERWKTSSLSTLSGFQSAAGSYGFKDCAEGADA